MTIRCAHRSVRGAAMVALGLCAWMLSVTARADETADARRHAQRASHLAAKGKCRQAVAEYDQAIPVLRDPALLFNRGECHRKLGNREAALHDYDQFLKELPTAPNRVQVESHIAELKNDAGSSSGPPGAAAAEAASKGERGASRPGPASPPSGVSANTATKPSSDRSSDRSAARPVEAAELAATPLRGSGATGGGGPGAALGADLTLLSSRAGAPAATPDSSRRSLVSRPWFWVAIGAVLAVGGAGTFLWLDRRGTTTIPMSALGNYRF